VFRGTYCDASLAVDTVHTLMKAIAVYVAVWGPPFGVPQRADLISDVL